MCFIEVATVVHILTENDFMQRYFPGPNQQVIMVIHQNITKQDKIKLFL